MIARSAIPRTVSWTAPYSSHLNQMPEKNTTLWMKQVMFSCALPPCSPTRKQSKIARERERKKSLQKGKDRYNIVKGLAEGVDGISFESLLKRRHYLRARNSYLILEPFDDAEDYRKETTFLPLQDMWFEGYFAFESMLNPSFFIRRCGEQLLLQKYENSHFFKEDSSFKLTRRRCIACVKVGSRVWARAEKDCFLRGVVTQMDEDIHVKLENGKKVKHKRTHPECVVADAIPHVMEVEVGSRVLAKWYNRLDTYYPGTVVAIRRSFFDIRFDDGDKGCNELRELRILRQKDLEEDGEKLALPPWSSLDGIPRVGGLCIEYGALLPTSPSLINAEITDDKLTTDYEIMSPLDSPVERISSPSEHAETAELVDSEHLESHTITNDQNDDNNHQGVVVFGFENNYQYLAPEISKGQPRNPSQVSGSSTDSGYHSNNHRQRKTGLWTVSNSQHNVSRCGSIKSQFLSPSNYLSHLHVPGLSEISDVERNLSELSVTSSVDSGFKGSGHSFRFQAPGSLVRCPGRAVPVSKAEEYSWEKEREHESEAGASDSKSAPEINIQLPNGPIGLETVI